MLERRPAELSQAVRLSRPRGSMMRSIGREGRAGRAAATLLALGAILFSGCSSAPKAERLSPQTMSSTPPPPTESLPGPDPRELPAEVPEAENTAPIGEAGAAGPAAGTARPELTVVIEDEASRQKKEVSLVQAAAAERARRATAGKSIAVVTDKNLAEFRDGQLTEMGVSSAPPKKAVANSSSAGSSISSSAPGEPADSAPASPISPEPEAITISKSDPEAYWRGRILRARMNWASAVEETNHLEVKIAELRQRFYAEDDPYYRDSQIKPSWDRALDRLAEAQTAIEDYRTEVQAILQEGRRAAALPGWLREGIDLEPDQRQDRKGSNPSPPGEYLPGEPKIAADPDGESR